MGNDSRPIPTAALSASAFASGATVAVAPAESHEADVAAHAADSDAPNWLAFLSVVVPLVFLAGLVHHFTIESYAFTKLLLLSAVGFAVNYLLPGRYRMPFFAGFSVLGLGVLLDVRHAAWIVSAGLALIGICHLPLAFRWRVALLVGCGLGLATLRVGWLPGPWPAGIWPVLGSMFMFRLIVYMYDLRHTPGLAAPARAIGYFFLLPNACFPLFPVVDYKAFCRSYYDTERHRIHHVGIQWIFRGVLQLILYRAVYQVLVSDPAAVRNVADLWQYFTWPFLLYLRVSGQFHVIVGILRLFGFNLPETHHSYYLASSFTDFWRRINIYWKDFMMKVFYYPAYFALRKRGNTFALIAATVMVFVLTWALHAYQWFWLRGSMLLAWNDVLFWTILATCVVFNSLHEVNHGRQRVLASRALPWPETAVRVAKTLGMFCFISLLWSLWSTESLGTWVSLWSAALRWPDAAPGWPSVISLCIPGLVTLAAIAESRAWRVAGPPSRERTAVIIVVTATTLVLVSTSHVYKRLGTFGTVVSALRFGGLNQADVAGLERGYYENLLGADRLNGDLWALYMNRPPEWNLSLVEAGVARPTDGPLPYVLLPHADGHFKGAVFRTNSSGLHDKEYAQLPRPGCRRIAVLGASHAMGSGVERGQTFEAVLENRLNQAPDVTGAGCLEILNFAVYGYNPLQQLTVLNDRVAAFAPHAVFYVAHPEDLRRVVRFLAGAITDRRPLPNPELVKLVREAGVDSTTPAREAEQRLAAYDTRVLSWLYRRFVDDVRRQGACPAFVFMPMVPEMTYATGSTELGLAKAAGFVPFDLMNVYEGADRSALWIAEWDAHPNARAHRILANRLFELLRSNSTALTCGAPQRDPRRGAAAQPLGETDSATRP